MAGGLTAALVGAIGLAAVVDPVPALASTLGGKTDLIARNSTTKDLYLYRGNGAGGFTAGTGTVVGNNWGAFDVIFSPGDFDGDGRVAVLARNATNKDLYLYSGGFRVLYEFPRQIQTGLFAQADVHQHKIRLELHHHAESIRAPRRHAGDRDPLLLENLPRDVQEVIVVVDDQAGQVHVSSIATPGGR
ncbi:hypothetical protein Psi02_57010 [Planotetraspora silvatica]|uniref:VCBS repeat-containing protein n=1 Tax=Planotetraspora silvatica TaxID=234614 RepID=A0A8J3UQ94_9ACTN|nr:VCBS repeat-containing protein [Planotetraspora silvatica]GII49277.1 hypothetical protein Psi02_57010 [Planotetraspora silvatica]